MSYEEAREHINVLEFTAILFVMKSLITRENIHVKLLCDNTTAVHMVKNMGNSHSLACNNVVKQVREFAQEPEDWARGQENNLKLNEHLPGVMSD